MLTDGSHTLWPLLTSVASLYNKMFSSLFPGHNPLAPYISQLNSDWLQMGYMEAILCRNIFTFLSGVIVPDVKCGLWILLVIYLCFTHFLI